MTEFPKNYREAALAAYKVSPGFLALKISQILDPKIPLDMRDYLIDELAQFIGGQAQEFLMAMADKAIYCAEVDIENARKREQAPRYSTSGGSAPTGK